MNGINITSNELILRLLLSAILGGIIGWERERKDGAAGLRTHMLVCVGSSLVMLVSMFGFNDVVGMPSIVLDPARVAAQVISGIGFLGAGTIFFLRPHIVRGLTTAAGLWSVAAVGLAVGGGLYLAAVLTTTIIFITLALVKPIEATIKGMHGKSLTMIYDPQRISYSIIEEIIKRHGLFITEVLIHAVKDELQDQVRITLKDNSNKDAITTAFAELKALVGVSDIVSRL